MKIILTIIIIVLILIEIFPIYKKIKKVETFEKKSGRLFLSTHNYEHKDIFIMFREIYSLNENTYVVFADKIWNRILEFLNPTIRFIYTNGNTTKKIIEKISLGYTVVMFLYNLPEPRTGLYHILNKTNCELILIQIKAKHEKTLHLDNSIPKIIFDNFNKHFIIEYTNLNYTLGDDPKKFMKGIKKYL